MQYLFDREVADPAWYFSASMNDPLFAAEPAEAVALFTCTMLNCGRDLAGYSNGQVCLGIEHLTSASCGNWVFDLKEKSLPQNVRDEAILTLSKLYSDCFLSRCAPVLGHLNEQGANPLNRVCYMFWDVTPLLLGNPEPVLCVLKDGLSSSNIACQESALHGLGHFRQSYGREREVADIVSEYLRRQRPPGALRAYAERAALGLIQ